MDILIKGMEMPTEGKRIDLTILSDGSVIELYPCDGEGHKAVALPEHGDLIDVNKLCKASLEIDNYCCDPAFSELLHAIWAAPVIVEASDGADS